MAENKPTDKKISDIQKFTETLAKYEEPIARVLGDGYVTLDEFMMSVITAIKSNPKKLLECEPRSLFASIFLAAELQLRISTQSNPEGFCYLIPRKGKCCCDLGYRGVLEIAYRSSKVKSIMALPVYENEFYSENENGFKHIKWNGMAINEIQLVKANKDFLKENGFSDDEINEFIVGYKERLKKGKGDLKLVFAYCQLEGLDNPIFTSVTLDVLKAIEKIAPSTQGENAHKSAYANGTDVHNIMNLKAAIKKLFKFLPKQHLDQKFARAIEIDDAMMSGKTPILEGTEVRLVDAKETEAEEKTKKYAAHFGDFEDAEFSESVEITPPPPVEKTAEPDKKADKKESKKK